MSPAKRDLLPKDVASVLNVSTDTIGRYARAGLIPFDKTPRGHRRFNLAEVQLALVDMDSNNLDLLRPPGGVPRNPLAPGPVVVMSRSARLRENLRATRTAPSFSSDMENAENSDHPDALEQDVLPKVAGLIRKLAMKPNPESDSNPEVRLVAAADSWYLGGNEKRVVFHVVISETSARKAGLWDEAESDFQDETLKAAQKKLLGNMRASLDSGSGYQIELKVGTLHGISAADLLEWDEWIVEDPIDPLAE